MSGFLVCREITVLLSSSSIKALILIDQYLLWCLFPIQSKFLDILVVGKVTIEFPVVGGSMLEQFNLSILILVFAVNSNPILILGFVNLASAQLQYTDMTELSSSIGIEEASIELNILFSPFVLQFRSILGKNEFWLCLKMH